jgi:hypothetical protein
VPEPKRTFLGVVPIHFQEPLVNLGTDNGIPAAAPHALAPANSSA